MYHPSRRLIGLLMLVFCVPLYAQTPRAFEQAALLSYEAKDYYAAYKYFDRVLEMEPNRADIALRCAESAALYGALAEAERYFDTAIKSNSLTGTRLGAALIGLGLVKKNLGKYEEAIALFEHYLTLPGSSAPQKLQATTEIANCEWAIEKLTNVDALVQVQCFEAPLNTAESEMGMFKVGSTYYFGGLYPIDWGDRYRPARPLLQVMVAENGKSPQPAWFNQPKKHTALPAFSPDGTLLILPIGSYVSGMEVQCDLFLLRQQNGTWSAPVRLPDYINQKGSTHTHPFIAPREDGYFDLYYSSDAPGGLGGKDIWKVKFSAQGVFDHPENLRAVNTVGEEASPFFDPTTQTLYFSSTGYLHLGGYDVYRSVRIGDQWAKPQHLPTPINSSHNDLFYRVLTDSEGLLTSNRIGAIATGDESCCYDLFKVEIQPQQVKMVAEDAVSGEQLTSIRLELYSSGSRNPLRVETSQPVELYRDKEYVLIASSPGYKTDTTIISTRDQDRYPPLLEHKVVMKPRPVEVHLEVYDSFSQKLLTDVSVSLTEGNASPLRIDYSNGVTGDPILLKLEPYSSYYLSIKKEGYSLDTLILLSDELSNPGTYLKRAVFLEPVNLHHFLPLALYFDNDAPKPASASQIMPYDQTYQAYCAQKDAYLKELAAAFLDPEERDCAVERLAAFFDEEVQEGYLRLENFADNLDLFLKNEYEVEILIKGFASPLASREYNLALTRRRVLSVKNYLRTVKDGMYNKYIINRRLRITLAPMGESSVLPNISDNYRKKHESVYSVEASRERRAEIIEVRLSKIFPSPDNQISE